MSTGVAALVALGGAVAYASTTGSELGGLAEATGAAALALLAAGLVSRIRGFIPWSVVLGAASYLCGRQGTSGIDGWAAAVGALLLCAAELATWSVEDDDRISTERPVVVRRLLVLGALATAAVVVDLLLLAAATIASAAGVAVVAAGVAASVAAVALVLRTVRA